MITQKSLSLNEINSSKQEAFFDKEEKRYPKQHIFNTPFHTTLELKEIFRSLAPIPKSANVIDLGAGSGRVTIPLLKKGLQVTAIDVSKKSLKDLKSLAQKSNFKLLKTKTFIPKNKKFDAVVGADILHHVNLDHILPQIYNSLKKNGRIVFSEPCAFNPSWYIYLPLASSWDVEKGVLKMRYYLLTNKLKEYGFKDIKIKGLGILPRPLFNFSKKLCILNDRIGDLPFLKLIAYRYIIIAEKKD